MTLDPVTIAAYAFGVLLLYLVARLLLIPVQFLARVAYHAGLGAMGLLVLNRVGALWEALDLYVPVNPITALVAGFLGLPGVAALLVLRHWLVAPLFGGIPPSP